MHVVATGEQRRGARRRVQAAILAAATFAIGACGNPPPEQSAEQRRPQQAGQPLNPYAMAARAVTARTSLAAGDSQLAQQQIETMAHDMSRSMRLPDTRRRIDHESARAAVRPLPGVRSAIWLDRENLAVMVGGQQYRTMAMIDRVCLALEPLGDTLAVVVNLQDATAKNGDEATTLSRNCQLPEGQRAMFQAKRKVDVIDPETREAFKRMQRE